MSIQNHLSRNLLAMLLTKLGYKIYAPPYFIHLNYFRVVALAKYSVTYSKQNNCVALLPLNLGSILFLPCKTEVKLKSCGLLWKINPDSARQLSFYWTL